MSLFYLRDNKKFAYSVKVGDTLLLWGEMDTFPRNNKFYVFKTENGNFNLNIEILIFGLI